jgi:DNA invertase Pin-like site-specific DNA recombinase
MYTIYGYLRAEVGQSQADLEKASQRLQRCYDSEGGAWGGVFCDSLAAARLPLEERPEGRQLLDLIEVEESASERSAAIILVPRLVHLGPTICDIHATLEHLDSWDALVWRCGARHAFNHGDHGRRMLRILEVAAGWEAALAEIERETRAPPNPPLKSTRLTEAQKKYRAEHAATERLIVELRDGGTSWTEVWRRITADGFHTAVGGKWTLSAIKRAYRMAKLRQLPLNGSRPH